MVLKKQKTLHCIRFVMFSNSEIKCVDNDKEAMIQHYSGNIQCLLFLYRDFSRVTFGKFQSVTILIVLFYLQHRIQKCFSLLCRNVFDGTYSFCKLYGYYGRMPKQEKAFIKTPNTLISIKGNDFFLKIPVMQLPRLSDLTGLVL